MKTTSYTQRRSPIWRHFPIDLFSRSPIARWAPVPLHLIVGYGFMEHGYAKLARGLDVGERIAFEGLSAARAPSVNGRRQPK